MTQLRAQGLSLAYGDRPVVHNLDLELTEGRVTAVVGANACGKSTLLRGLAGLAQAPGRRRAARRAGDRADAHA
jgi:iron complex transport system ATP-binding protein